MTKKLALLLTVALAACGDQAVNLGGNYQVSAFVPPIANPNIDLLFVVDNSGSIIDNQMALAAHAKAALFDVIDAAISQPNLHVGVITPDMDTAATGDVYCDDGGDRGRLQIGACAGIDGNYLIDVDDGAGGRITNYTGTIDEAFGCIAQVGDHGCGFEQPLAATVASLTEPSNAGFLRDEAMLVVVILTDEDDCSAAPGLFDPSDLTHGPMDSYRCFHAGVQCAEDLDTDGVKTECGPSDDPIMDSLTSMRDSLVLAKGGDPTKVMVAAIAGTDEPTEVVHRIPGGGSEPRLDLAPSCIDNTDPSSPGSADPAHRLTGFLDLFPGLSWRESICDPIDPALARTANVVGDVAAQRPCLRGEFKDVDPDTAGTQPSCRAFYVTGAYTPAEQRTELHECRGHEGNCFQIIPDTAACSHWPGGFSIGLVATQPAANQDLIVECLQPDAD